MMDGKARLMQGGGDGLADLARDGFPFEDERMQMLLRNGEDRMLRDFVHGYAVSQCSGYKDNKSERKTAERCKILNEKRYQLMAGLVSASFSWSS